MVDAAPAALVGALSSALALALIAYLVLAPRPLRLSKDRRRPNSGQQEGALARGAAAATAAIERVMRRRNATSAESALVAAGSKMRQQDFVFLIVVRMIVGLALGLLVGGILPGLLLALAVPLFARLVLGFKADRRRAAFADQLDDSLQLLASSLRAGHSLLQALDSVARESEEPTSEEFSRIINETRMGRELSGALEETAQRMGSEDFRWVTQAIAINREVGGNLAEVLDGVGHTIRERNEIRRQVKSLSAEGKLSAYILIGLPFFIVGFLTLLNPSHMGSFLTHILGWGLMGLASVLLVVGIIWMRRVVQIKF